MLKLLSTAALALVLSGCASFNNLSNEVSTWGLWPAERKPATYSFERLPSQQDHPERQQMLEDAARGALEAAGFRAAVDANDAEYLMQVGARVTSNDPWIYNDPLFWRGGYRFGVGYGYGMGYGYGRWGRAWGPAWSGAWGPWGPGWYGYGYGYDGWSNFEREVALLVRDRATGQLLYEARAHNNGPSTAIDPLLPAMFSAALKDFPVAGPNPRKVTVPIATP